ncbi:hypothetical protein RUND412_005991 [Rhizina undulata]
MSAEALAAKFQLLEELGSGSFGVVYKAIERDSGTIVAIKHINLESSEDDIQEIQQEITVLSTCASPFVTQYYGSFVRGYKLWIIMEYLAGGSCLDLLKPGPFSEAHIAILMRELLLGLDYLHREGKIHRDIKAANILLSGTGQVKLADFGVAAQLTDLKSQRNTFVGTPFWMAPEVIAQTEGYDYKADIWSLGITAIELAQGEPPKASIHPMKVLFLIPKEPAPKLEGSEWSREFKDFIARCLVKDPEVRASAKDLLKHRFIRNAGRIELLQELIERKQHWEAGRGGRHAHPRLYQETISRGTLSSSPEDCWDFDTIRSNIPAPTLRIAHYNKSTRTIERGTSSITLTRGTTSALQGLNLNTAPHKDNPHARGRSVSNTAVRVGRHRDSVSSITARNDIPEEKQACQPPPTSQTNHGRTGSTVKPSKKVSDQSPKTAPRSSMQEPRTKNENKTRVAVPTTEDGFLGRQIHSNVIQKTFQEMQAAQTGQSNSKIEREALSRLEGAWDHLNNIDPESGSRLLRTLLEKLQQQPQLQSIVAPSPPLQVQSKPLVSSTSLPEISTKIPPNIASILSSSSREISPREMSPREMSPREYLRQSRSGSLSSGGIKDGVNRRRGSKQSDEMSIEEEQCLSASTSQGSQLADVLYGRWLEGMKSRWGGFANV